MKKLLSHNYRLIAFTLIILINSIAAFSQDTTVTLIEADGPGETYQLLGSKLGGSPIEAPDCDHSPSFQHIVEEFDSELDKNVFKFYIHKDIDTDRCKTAVDRQRNEIKSYDPSPHYLKAIQREVVTYEWYFKIDAEFHPSANFTHLFQLKAVGGTDDANPILTITPRKGNPEELQLIHGRGSNSYTTVTTAGLPLIKGNWVHAYCEVVYAEDTGSIDFSLKLLDGTEVLTYKNNKIDMWRAGSSFVRPKWGIYRSLNDLASLRDEEVLFADFKITEVGACPPWYEDADGDGLGDPNSFVYACERPDGYVKNNVDSCQDWYADSDGDGLGDPGQSKYACEQPEGYVDNEDDLDDTRNDLLSSRMIEKGLYPNPVHLTLELKGFVSDTQYLILDVSGRVLKSGTGNRFPVSDLDRGVHFLKTTNGKVFRFIKE